MTLWSANSSLVYLLEHSSLSSYTPLLLLLVSLVSYGFSNGFLIWSLLYSRLNGSQISFNVLFSGLLGLTGYVA